MFVNEHFRQRDIILIPIPMIGSIIVITYIFPVISIERAQGFLRTMPQITAAHQARQEGRLHPHQCCSRCCS